jgi:hypothetical protein
VVISDVGIDKSGCDIDFCLVLKLLKLSEKVAGGFSRWGWKKRRKNKTSRRSNRGPP